MLILALFCGQKVVENQIFASSASVTAFKLRYLMQGLFCWLEITQDVVDDKKCIKLSSFFGAHLFLDSVLSDPANAARLQNMELLLGDRFNSVVGVSTLPHWSKVYIVLSSCNELTLTINFKFTLKHGWC